MSIAEKLQTVAENQQKVYDAGFAAGQAAGGDTEIAYNEGYTVGQQAAYDAFWDNYQAYGSADSVRISCQAMFSGEAWNDNTFKPKYSMKPQNAMWMFRQTSITGDLQQKLETFGVEFDFSNVVDFTFAFAYMRHITRLGIISTVSSGGLNNAFSNSNKLETIDKLIFKDDGSQTFTNPFTNCSALRNLTIEGVIGGSIGFPHSPLSKASIESIMNALSNATTGLTATFKKTAVNAAFATDEWNALVATKPNWTITLV